LRLVTALVPAPVLQQIGQGRPGEQAEPERVRRCLVRPFQHRHGCERFVAQMMCAGDLGQVETAPGRGWHQVEVHLVGLPDGVPAFTQLGEVADRRT